MDHSQRLLAAPVGAAAGNGKFELPVGAVPDLVAHFAESWMDMDGTVVELRGLSHLLRINALCWQPTVQDTIDLQAFPNGVANLVPHLHVPAASATRYLSSCAPAGTDRSVLTRAPLDPAAPLCAVGCAY
jgi:hypothetical protein